eukprot:9883-Heterococcus_DN1.PRE.2
MIATGYTLMSRCLIFVGKLDHNNVLAVTSLLLCLTYAYTILRARLSACRPGTDTSKHTPAAAALQLLCIVLNQARYAVHE